MTESRRDTPQAAENGPKRLVELFAAVGRGELAALDALYDRFADELYGLALWRTGSPADADDVVQEVFVRLAATRRRLGSVADPRAYLRRMAHSAAIDVHRKSARRREAPLEECAFLESADDSPERRAEAQRVSELLGRLPPAQREAIYLRHFAGCSFAEIGRATRVPTFTAASRYRIGMRRLKQLVGVDP
jgi:RNA polymerase sigma-70 factor (ECF subfamily)